MAIGLFACGDDDGGFAPDTVLDDTPEAVSNQRRVSITFHANGDANHFFCQLDSQDPVECVSPFEAEVADGEHQFQVAASLNAKVDTTPAMFAWRVDATPPDTQITSAPPTLDNSIDPTFTFEGTDGASAKQQQQRGIVAHAGELTFECSLDNGTFSACTSPHTVTVGAGQHSFTVRAVDDAGNPDSDPPTHSWTVDVTTPDTDIVSGPAAGSTTGPSVELAFASPDTAATFECSMDAAAFTACPTPFAITGLLGGSHTFAVRAKAVSGAVDPTPASVTWTVDDEAPAITLVAVPPALSNDATPTFEFTSPDATATFECAPDGVGFAACTSPHTTAALTDGPHTFVVRATDPYGNSATAQHAWTIDTVGPSVAITAGPNPVIGTTSTSFTFTASGHTGAIECALDAAAFAACTSPFAASGLGSGAHTFVVRATDDAGNVASANRDFFVDTTPPTVTITDGPPSFTVDNTPTFSFTATDATTLDVECRIDSGAFADCTSPLTTAPLADGAHTFTVRATDQGSNTASAQRMFTVDTAPPVLTITAPPANPGNDPTPSVGFTVTGANRVECSTDGGAFATCNSPFTAATLADGSHTISIRAFDAANNSDLESTTFTIDTVAPTISITLGPSGPTNDPTPTYSFVASNDTAVTECRVDSASFAPCTSAFTTATLSDGPHVFEVQARDAAGNTASTTRSIIVDTASPTVAISPPVTPTNDNTPTITFSTAGSPATIECRVDTGGFAPCTSPFTTPTLSDALHSITVRVTDAAGNSSQATTSITVDTVAPVVTVAAVADPTNDNTPAVAFTVSGGTNPQCSVDGGAFAACVSPFTPAALADGSHTIVVQATDTAGNAGSGSTTFTVDTAAPDTSIVANPTNPSNDPTGDFQFASADPTATFQCRIGAAAFAACTTPFATTALTDGTYTLQVRAIDPAGNIDATPAAFTWTVDTAPPNTTLTATEPDPTSDSTGDFAFSSSQTPATFQCSVDGAAFTACASPFATIALTDGTHTFAVRAIDAAGNTDPTPATHSWTVDSAPPDTTITSAPSDPDNDATGDFAFTGTEPGTFQCSVDGAAFAACTSPFATATLGQGVHTFSVRAVDAAGNVDPSPDSHTWTVDTIAPNTAFEATEPNPTNDPTGDFSFTATEPGATFECSLDGGAFAACAASFSTPALGDGTHTLSVRARDQAGNVDATPATHTWVVDTAPPDTTITASEPDPTNDTTADFTFSAPGATSFQCSVDGGAFAPCTTPFATAALSDGPHTFAVRGVDAAGNVDATPATASWTQDTVAPDTTLTATEPDPTNDTTGDFAFSSSDAGATFQCSVDGAAFSACTSPFSTAALAAGTHTFSVRARDAATNVDATPATHTWVIDTTPPATNLTATEPNPTNDTTGDFAFSSPDPSATFECSVDSGGFAACVSPFSTAVLAQGTHTFEVRAVDGAGNADATPASHTWVIDTTPPNTTLVSAEPSPTNDATADFSFSSSQTGTFECSVDGAAFTTCISPFATSALADGEHNFAVRATDLAGNVDTSPASHTWILDTTAPDTTLTATEPNPTNDPTGDFAFSSTDPTATFECSVDGAAFSACSSPFATASLGESSHTFAVRARDPLGNTDASPATHTWTVDVTAPVVTITTPPPNPTADNTPTVAFGVTGTFSTLRCRVDSGPLQVCTTPSFTAATLADGTHTISIIATDAAGNAGTAATTFVVDTTPPAVAITGGIGPTTFDPNRISFTHGADAVRIECRVDLDPYTDCSSPFDGPQFFEQGAHSFDVRVADAAGNEAIASAIYELDPTVECLDGSDNLGQDVVTGNVESLTKMTIEFWFRANGTEGEVGLLGFDVAQRAVPAYVGISWNTAWGFHLDLFQKAGVQSLREFLPPAGFDFNQWHHYAFTLDGTTQRLFVDGTEVTNVKQLAGSPAMTFRDVFLGVTANVLMAVGTDTLHARVPGAFLDLRVSNEALYGATFLPQYPIGAAPSTIMLYPMDEGEGTLSFNEMNTSPGVTWNFSSWNTCGGGTGNF